MSLKTSFFNKGIFKSDIKRFWWVSLIETFLIMITTVLPCYERCKRSFMLGNSWNYKPSWFSGAIAILIIFAVAVSVLLFTYMHFTASVSTFHSFPVKRGNIFSTKLISGAVLTITPVIINAGLLAIMGLNPGFEQFVAMRDVLNFFLTGVLYTVLLFSLATFTNMITGNPIGTIVFTFGVAILPLVIIGSFQSFFDMELYGYASNAENILKYIYIDEKDLLKLGYFLIYAVLTVLLFAGAYYLYKKRKLEAYGEVIAFSWLKPVFVTIISVLASIMSYFYFVGALGRNGLLWLLPFGIIGTVVSWMIAKKSMSLRGIIKPVLIYLVGAFIFIGIIHFDLTGFERRVPSIFDIKSVSIVRDNEMQWYSGGEPIDYWLKGEMDYSFTEKEEFVEVLDFHQYMIKKRNEEQQGGILIPVEYKLKNGRRMVREYEVDFSDDAEFLRPLYETKQLRGSQYSLINGAECEYVELKITDRRFKNGTFKALYPDNPDMLKVINALKKDFENASYEDMTRETGESVRIDMSYVPVYESEGNIEELKKTRGALHNGYSIYPSFENTVALLEEMDFYNSLPKASDIAEASVYTWENTPLKEDVTYSYGEPTDYMGEGEGIKVLEPEKIAELYSRYDDMIRNINFSNYNNCKNIKITYTLNNGHIFEVSCSYDADKIPEEFLEYFK